LYIYNDNNSDNDEGLKQFFSQKPISKLRTN